MNKKIITDLDNHRNLSSYSKRDFLSCSLLGSASLLAAPKMLAAILNPTPVQIQGPFYPNVFPLDIDNDLLFLNDNITPAAGEVTYLNGTVTDIGGNPLKDALVEIWQVDNTGAYIHTGSTGHADRDLNFQGYGKILTNAKGEYNFRTIKPVAYSPRTPHIHFKITYGKETILITQLYIEGVASNDTDSWLQSAGDRKDDLIVPFSPRPGSTTGELNATFNIVLGITPEDPVTGLEAWKKRNFPGADVSTSADSADPDNDNITNLMEYAFGLDPNQANAHNGIRISQSNDTLNLFYSRNREASDLNFEVQHLKNLPSANWTTASVNTQMMGSINEVDNMRASFSLPVNDKYHFLRLKVSKKP